MVSQGEKECVTERTGFASWIGENKQDGETKARVHGDRVAVADCGIGNAAGNVNVRDS